MPPEREPCAVGAGASASAPAAAAAGSDCGVTPEKGCLSLQPSPRLSGTSKKGFFRKKSLKVPVPYPC